MYFAHFFCKVSEMTHAQFSLVTLDLWTDEYAMRDIEQRQFPNKHEASNIIYYLPQPYVKEAVTYLIRITVSQTRRQMATSTSF